MENVVIVRHDACLTLKFTNRISQYQSSIERNLLADDDRGDHHHTNVVFALPVKDNEAQDELSPTDVIEGRTLPCITA